MCGIPEEEAAAQETEETIDQSNYNICRKSQPPFRHFRHDSLDNYRDALGVVPR